MVVRALHDLASCCLSDFLSSSFIPVTAASLLFLKHARHAAAWGPRCTCPLGRHGGLSLQICVTNLPPSSLCSDQTPWPALPVSIILFNRPAFWPFSPHKWSLIACFSFFHTLNHLPISLYNHQVYCLFSQTALPPLEYKLHEDWDLFVLFVRP